MNISRSAYDQHSFLIRQAALHLWGVPLMSRADICRIRELYSLNDFYVELCYDKQTGKPTCICSFSRTQRLELYLSELSLADLSQ